MATKSEKSPYGRALRMALGDVGQGIYNMFQSAPQRKVSSDTTNALNRFRQISKEGIYNQGAKNEVMADVKQNVREGDMKLRNLATRQGMENSSIIADQLIKKEGKTTLETAKIARAIFEANEKAKSDASVRAMEIGQGIEDIAYNNALARQQKRDDTFASFKTGFDAYNQDLKDQESSGELDSLMALILQNPELAKLIC